MHRSGRRREPRGAQLGLPLLFAALALAGLIVGGVFGTYIIRSLIEATTPPGAPPGGTSGPIVTPPVTPGTTTPGTTPGPTTPGGTLPAVRITVQSRTYHSVQIGAFSDLGPAQAAARQAEEKGLPALAFDPVSGTDKLYRVRCALVPSREAADALLARVKAAGYGEAFINTLTTSALDITVQAASSTYLAGFSEAVSSLTELATAAGAAYNSYATGGFTSQAISGHLAGLNAAAGKVRGALAGLTPPADLRERHEVLLGLVNMADAAAIELAAIATEGQSKYPRAMTEYMGFVATFSRVCNSWR